MERKRPILVRWQQWMVGSCVVLGLAGVGILSDVRNGHGRAGVTYWSMGEETLNHPQGRVEVMEVWGVSCEWMIVPGGRALRVESEWVADVGFWIKLSGVFGLMALGATVILVVKDVVFGDLEAAMKARRKERRRAYVAQRFDVISAGDGGKLKEAEQSAALGEADGGRGDR